MPVREPGLERVALTDPVLVRVVETEREPLVEILDEREGSVVPDDVLHTERERVGEAVLLPLRLPLRVTDSEFVADRLGLAEAHVVTVDEKLDDTDGDDERLTLPEADSELEPDSDALPRAERDSVELPVTLPLDDGDGDAELDALTERLGDAVAVFVLAPHAVGRGEADAVFVELLHAVRLAVVD